MALTPAKLASVLGMAALLAGGAAFAQSQSPLSPRRPDCAAFPPTSEAYRDCISGRVIREPTGRRGTSPGTMGTDPTRPGSPTSPNPPGMAPVPGTPGTGTNVPGRGTGMPGPTPGTGVPGTVPGTGVPGQPGPDAGATGPAR